MLILFESDRLGYGKVVINATKGYGIPEGVTAIIGNNGSGKTTLGIILEKGRYAYGNRLKFKKPDLRIKMLSFTDIHSLSGMEVQYSAQRMESTMNDMVPTVAEILGESVLSPKWVAFADSLGLKDVNDKKINYLSSGELRKLIIINALLSNPELLILDNPYIGLDVSSRKELNGMLLNLRNKGVSIVLLVCDESDIPPFTDNIMTLENCHITGFASRSEYISSDNKALEGLNFILPSSPRSEDAENIDYTTAFEIKNGHIRYGDRRILENFNWKINKGERWVLTGPNGSGKSLLLSMVCADNPQGYANDIILFDRKRGSGESIWEIKNNIGYVSPEMQLFFKSMSSVREIIIQGLRNSLNRYSKPTENEIGLADEWMNIIGIGHLADRKFSELSAGEQRLVLVIRAMIKQPQLLVLDEPLHGLDTRNKEKIKRLITLLVERNETTLILVTHYASEIPEYMTHTKELKKS